MLCYYTSMISGQFLTVEQAADKLQFHVATVRRMLRLGQLPGIKLGGGKEWRVSAQALDRYLVTAAQPPETRMLATDYEINEIAVNAFDELIAWHTVGVVASRHGKEGAGIGTGACVLWRGQTLILTAFHNIEGTPNDKIWFFFRPEGTLQRCVTGRIPPTLQRGELYFRESIAVSGIKTDPELDLAAIEVPISVQDRYRTKFYKIDSVSATPAAGAHVMLRGYPSALSQRVGANLAASANHEYTSIVSDRPSGYADSQDSFFMPWNSESWDPLGFSGAGVWFQNNDVDPSSLWRANPALVGIATSYYRASNLMMAVRIETVLQFLANQFPAT